MKLFRQGDVLVRQINKLPAAKDLKPIARDNGKVVLAYGEVTGHSHAIESKSVDFLLNEATMQRFLKVENKTAVLHHEEHSEIELPVGCYEVIQQKEFSLDMIRSVAD
jgi:hypothetical protein